MRSFRLVNLSWLCFAGLVIILDQLTKELALANLTLFEPVKIFEFFNLLLSFNTGAAFSLFGDASGWQQWLFGSIAAIVSIVIIITLLRQQRGQALMSFGLSLVLGGALGNLYDRIARGYVVDFIHLHIQDWSWPIFNIADTAICLGAALLIFELLTTSN